MKVFVAGATGFIGKLSRQRPRVRVPSSPPFFLKQLGGFH